MNKYSQFETERLICRQYRQEDLEIMVENLNLYDVAKNLLVPFPYTIEDGKHFLNRVLEKNTAKNCFFAVTIKSTGEFIGSINICVAENNVGEGGIWISPKHHRKGYGCEVWKGRAKFAFEVLGADCLSSGYLEGNEASRIMQQKMGFKLTGERAVKICPARGGAAEEIKLKLTKEDFYKNI